MQVNKEIKVGDLVRQKHFRKGIHPPLAIVTHVSPDGLYIKMIWQDDCEEDGCHVGRVVLVTPDLPPPPPEWFN